jgi:acetamidase/formamidase
MSHLGRCDHSIHRHQTHHAWDKGLAPVLEVKPGESVEFAVQEASGGQLSRTSDVSAVANLDFSRVNPVAGPIFIAGAKSGDVLAVEILELGLEDWGWTAIIPGFGLLADEFPAPYLKVWDLKPGATSAAFNDKIDIPLNPFPGTIGVAPPEPGPHSIVPPRNQGGNLDIRHLTAGTTLLLPVAVEGALFSVGDTHAAQGDGEVCGTAIESPMRIALRFKVRKDLTIEQPQYLIPRGSVVEHGSKGYYVTTGIAPDLMEATRKAIRAMLNHLQEQHSLSREEAYALASIAVDLRISEVVDAPNWVVSAFLPQVIFRG